MIPERAADPAHRRTFGRLTAFELAWPNCGTVDCVKRRPSVVEAQG
jgi:hypothetical protein